MKLPTFRTLFWCAAFLVRATCDKTFDQCGSFACCAVNELNRYLEDRRETL